MTFTNLASETHPHARHIESDAYRLWKAEGPHLAEYACEFIGTALIVLAVVGFVALMQAPISPLRHAIPSMALRLLIAGACIATTGSLFTITPLGRLSGAHINPAVSFGFWLLGKMHTRDLCGYVAAQICGGVIGAVAGRIAFGEAAAQIHLAMLGPAPGVSVAVCFWSEMAATLPMCYFIYTFVSIPALMRYTPLMCVPVIAAMVCADGAVSGAGLNPARWFGPAAVLRDWRLGWLYIAAPIVAAAISVLMRRYLPRRGHAVPHTGKLYHDSRFRSLFRKEALPSTPPGGLIDDPPTG